ncbi:hypothetical protein ABBQ38_009547 [Trebouxia sp. C0009 RCD-2024]
MSISALRQVLAEKLGERDTNRFSDVHLQNLLDKEYRDEAALQDATREGLQTPPALPPALIDKILKGVGQPGLNVSEQLFRERVRQELELVCAEPPSKRSCTACREYSTLLAADCDEVKLWNAEVQDKVPCEIATFEELLGMCPKDRRLLPDLRYLQLLLAEPSQLRKEIFKLINMCLTRPISPHVDAELEYHAITLALFQGWVSVAYVFSQRCMMSMIQQGKTSDAALMGIHWSPVKSQRLRSTPQMRTQMAFTAIKRA